MKILATNDIHQLAQKWKQVVEVCIEKQPDVLILAGDLFPHNDGLLKELDYMGHVKKYAKQISDKSDAKIVLILGNDDNQLLIPEIEQGEKDGLWHYVSEKVVKIGDYEFAGMPYVPDHPFGYKYWVAPEFKDELRIYPYQYGEYLLIDNNNNFESIKDFKKHLQSKKPIYDCLKDIASKVRDIKKSIWLIHAPPSGWNLDVCANGAKVGSGAVLKFIEDYQPFITIHGHIHESPECNGHQWYAKIGKTIAIQAGQVDRDLNYITMELEGCEIKDMKHSDYI